MSFLDALAQTTNQTETANGAVSNLSTLSSVLDFFSRAGAMRGDVEEAVKLFNRAYADNPQMALKALFYLRDVRGGQGERRLFRECLKEVPKSVQRKLPHLIPVYGRWDDILCLDTNMIQFVIETQLVNDEVSMAKGEPVSLLAKWLPSINTSSPETVKKAREIAKALKLKPSQYRKRLTALRKYIKLLEQKMSANEWQEIQYDKIPSQALRKHVGAFRRHDDERFSDYLKAVEAGKKSIKTSTLYTYEVYDTLQKDSRLADAMWENLPDYTNGANALVLADVSGSMNGRPMSISVSLALYFAERNKGPFYGHFMTFTTLSRLVKVRGDSLSTRMNNIENADWDGSTNIESAFKAILDAAIREKATQEEMPAILYVISDMEFNQCIYNGGKTNLENAREMFEQAGYKLPHVVFWNVNSWTNQMPATKYDEGVTLISGASQSTFRYAVEGKSPLESMYEIINSERYAAIEI